MASTRRSKDQTSGVDPLSICAQEIEIRGSKEKMMDVEVWVPSNHKGSRQYRGEGNEQKTNVVNNYLGIWSKYPKITSFRLSYLVGMVQIPYSMYF